MLQRSLLGLASVIAATLPAHAADKFDGNWLVVIVCDPAQKGAEGYTYRFPATVTGSILHGLNGVAGQPASMTLDGPIQPDGTALLLAQGLTGSPDYTVGHVTRATPYTYHMQAHFDAGHGIGSRIELRACSGTFTRQ